MSRRTAVVEEFDDDTDLPLPSHPLPNTGTRGAILSELSDDEFDDYIPTQREPTAGPASPSQTQFKAPTPDRDRDELNARAVTDMTPYKKWTCVYPIYIDAKRPHGTGERRIARSKGVWWPLSRDIADAAMRLGLGTLHEINKAHPRDWENPGRVRVQWKKDGRLVNAGIKTKKQLLEMISQQIQSVKPDNVPRPPYTSNPTNVSSATEPAPAPAPSKGKQPASGKSSKAPGNTNVPISTSKPPSQSKKGRPRPPSPPAPHPPLTNRVSPYSPALPSGVLIETIKAGMSTQEGAPATGGGGGKGKRKVVRVRG